MGFPPAAILSVSDTGQGIPEKDIDRIFDPYFTAIEEGKGSGMGLAVVHGIVTSSDGAIAVDLMKLAVTKRHLLDDQL